MLSQCFIYALFQKSSKPPKNTDFGKMWIEARRCADFSEIGVFPGFWDKGWGSDCNK